MSKILPRNPVYLFIMDLLSTGQTTIEEICVATGIKYPTFTNALERPLVSPNIRTMLVVSGIMPRIKLKEYDIWFQKVYLAANPRKKRASHKTTPTRTKNKRRVEVGGIEKIDSDAP